MWMWCRSWSLQREVRTKQTAGEQGISPLVMKARDSGMDCAPRGRKRKMGKICYDWQREKEKVGLIQIDSCCSACCTSSACHMCTCWGGCWIHEAVAIHPVLAFTVLIVCVRVCSAGVPVCKQEILSHCSFSIKNHGQALRVSRLREFDWF